MCNIRYMFMIFAWFLGLICIVHAEQHIIPIQELSECKDEIESLDCNSLVIWDVDNTLIFRNDAALQPRNDPLMAKLLQEKGLSQKTIDHLSSVILATAEQSIIDPNCMPIIRRLQERQIPTIALTAFFTGEQGIIKNGMEQRIEQLLSFGFDFSSAFSNSGFFELKFPVTSQNQRIPAFRAGIIFTSGHPKGDMLQEFIKVIDWVPQRIIFFDDRKDALESVALMASRMGIPFMGFHYLAGDKWQTELDIELIKKQCQYLVDYAIWLSDSDAKTL